MRWFEGARRVSASQVSSRAVVTPEGEGRSASSDTVLAPAAPVRAIVESRSGPGAASPGALLDLFEVRWSGGPPPPPCARPAEHTTFSYDVARARAALSSSVTGAWLEHPAIGPEGTLASHEVLPAGHYRDYRTQAEIALHRAGTVDLEAAEALHVDPVSFARFSDPVVTCDGQTHDLATIVVHGLHQLLRNFERVSRGEPPSPLRLPTTNQPLTSAIVLRNRALAERLGGVPGPAKVDLRSLWSALPDRSLARVRGLVPAMQRDLLEGRSGMSAYEAALRQAPKKTRRVALEERIFEALARAFPPFWEEAPESAPAREAAWARLRASIDALRSSQPSHPSHRTGGRHAPEPAWVRTALDESGWSSRPMY